MTMAPVTLRKTLSIILTQLKNGTVCFRSSKSDPAKSGNEQNDKARKRRWAMLLIFSLNSMLNACMFISLSAITNIVSKYYKVEPFVIDWLSNIFLLIYFLFGIPAALLTSLLGLRPIILVGSLLHAIAGVLRFFGTTRDRFPLVMAGQILAALACCTILQVPARLSNVWFGKREQAMATSIGAFMNVFGVALGFVVSSQMVRDSSNMDDVAVDIYWLFLWQMVMCLGLLLATILFFQERPPTAADQVRCTDMNGKKRCKEFMVSLKQLLSNRNFNLVAQSYAIYFGLMNSFSVLLNTIITSEFPRGHEAMVGWMGFACLVVSIPSTLLLGILLDRYEHYRCQAVFLHVCSCLLMFAFMIVLTQARSFTALFVLYVCYGLVAVPYYCTGLSHTAFLTFPVPESTSSSVVLTLANLYGFVMILVLGKLANDGYVRAVGYAMAGLYVVALVFAALAKTKVKKRLDLEASTNQASLATIT